MSKPNGIVAMNPEKYREIDGIVFDEASYARHCQPAEPETPALEAAPETNEPQSAAPAPVFAVDPYPEGWYPADDDRPPVPIMGGAVPSTADRETGTETGETTVTQTVCVLCGSGSGSYVTSYTTSYTTSYSGSGSFRFGSGSCAVGGYGLELI